MTDDLRRQDDVLLASIDKRLALVEQAARLSGEAATARSAAHDAAINALGTKLDGAVSMWQTVSAEPQASPAGRALVADLEALSIKVEEHDDFVTSFSGALKLARFAFGTSIVSAVASILAILALISGQSA